MAAYQHQHASGPTRSARKPTDLLSYPALIDRLEEEINRSTRHSTPLCCLLLRLENLKEIGRIHGTEIVEQLVAYTSMTLRSEFRRFDRLGEISEEEFMVLLPGADSLRSEIVARRVLGRLRAIKVELDDQRVPLRVTISVVAWHGGQTAEQLLAHARAATPREQLGLGDAVRI
ncbi:MAG TPA: GGDEF domain-containing protein [Solirubrobacteraceae bacterium]|jgi:diguanylate cyclase (GGDEF)-like protein